MATKAFSLLRFWALPVAIATTFFVGGTLVFAAQPPTADELAEYLQDNELEVGSDTVKGYVQTYYMYEGRQVFITKGNINHAAAGASGQHIAWISTHDGPEQQVYLHDVLNKTTVQISGYGTNGEVILQENKMVWRKWVEGKWQLFYYDGLSAYPISSLEGSSDRARWQDNTVVYTQYVADDPDGQPWHVLQYDMNTTQTTLFSKTDDPTKAYPYFDSEGNIKTEYSIEYLNSRQ